MINTQRMLCSNQAMTHAPLRFLAEEPPVLLDWLPWNHTFGGNYTFNIALYNGGSLYIDEGKPLPGAIEATVRNLRDVAPTIYFNVPKGFEMLVPHLQADRALREKFFSQLKVMFYAGASLPQHVRNELEAVGGRDDRGAHYFSLKPRLDGDCTVRTVLQLGFGPCRQYGPAASGRDPETRSTRGQARGAAQRPDHHARLLARAGADRKLRSTRKAFTKSAMR